MNLLVCLKQIHDPALVAFNLDKKELEAPAQTVNPLDLVALEQALRLRAAQQASVTVITVGTSSADDVLRQGLTTGADRAVRIWDEQLQDADAGAVARVLALAAQRLQADLIMCGARSADSGAECLGAHLAAELKMPYITRAVWLEHRDGVVSAHVREEQGWREEYQAELPVVVGVEAALNEPRYVPMLSRSYKRGLGQAIEVWDAASLGATRLGATVIALGVAAPRPRTKVGVKVTGLSMAEKLKMMRGGQGGGKKQEMLTGEPSRTAQQILEKIKEWLA